MSIHLLSAAKAYQAIVVFVDESKKFLTYWNDKSLRQWAEPIIKQDFLGRYKESLLLYPPQEGPTKRLLVMGAGKANKLTLHKVRALAAAAAAFLRDKGHLDRVGIAVPSLRGLKVGDVAEAIQTGIELHQFSFRDFKTDSSDEEKQRRKPFTFDLLVADKADAKIAQVSAEKGRVIAEGVNWARRIILLSGEQLGPSELAQQAQKMVASSKNKTKLKISVWDEKELKKNKFGGLLCVGRGSERPPRFIVIEYRNAAKSRAPICLVGKGITFDSGGLSLKPGPAMETMKYDMAGAASVLAATKIVAGLGLKVNLVTLVPAAENMPSGRATRPGDIIEMGSGKTVEILNTDAEGRLVLSDALHYGSTHYSPKFMVDVATLTGSCALAVGEAAAGLFTNNKIIETKLQKAGQEAGENLFPLPNYDDFYVDLLRSDVADLKNIGGREAGASTAAIFLRHFVKEGTPWAHLDIAGCGWYDSPRDFIGMRGPSGIPIRTLVQFVENEG